MTTIQTNVRVAAEDKPLIVALAARLRADPGFRDRLRSLLQEHSLAVLLDERVATLEQQVSWLLSGAIVVPRPTPVAPPRLPKAASPLRPPFSQTRSTAERG